MEGGAGYARCYVFTFGAPPGCAGCYVFTSGVPPVQGATSSQSGRHPLAPGAFLTIIVPPACAESFVFTIGAPLGCAGCYIFTIVVPLGCPERCVSQSGRSPGEQEYCRGPPSLGRFMYRFAARMGSLARGTHCISMYTYIIGSFISTCHRKAVENRREAYTSCRARIQCRYTKLAAVWQQYCLM